MRRMLAFAWDVLWAIASFVLAVVAGVLPRRHWVALDPWIPVSRLAMLSAVATFLTGAAIGIPGYISHTQANASAAARLMMQALGIRPTDVPIKAAEGMAQAAWHSTSLSMMTFTLTPAGLISLYLLVTGAVRSITVHVDDAQGDPVLTAVDAVMRKRRTAGAARRRTAAREALEGPEVPDRLITGKAAGIPEAELVVVASRRKPEWGPGVFVITPDAWYRVGLPVERQLPAGLRTLYPLTEIRDLEVRRKSVDYVLPPLGGSVSLTERNES